MRPYLFKSDSKYYTLPPLTDEAVRATEEKLGVNLPKSYLNVLKEKNGGYLRFNSYRTPVPTSWGEDHITVDHLMGVGTEKGIIESPYFIGEWGLPDHLALLCGDGHTWIALDYRACGAQGDPSIVYVDVECDPMEDMQIAPSFETFIEGLVDGSHRHVFGFTGVGEDGTSLLGKLEEVLECKFETSKILANYYEVVHPVFKNHDNDDQAKLLLRPHHDSIGHLDYPWQPECDWILSCDIRKVDKQAIEERLNRLPYDVVLIHTPHWGGE